jgi:hypothetical protein
MESAGEHAGRSDRMWRVLWWTVAAFLVYFLSSGPVYWCAWHKVLPAEVILIYLPLDVVPGCSHLFGRYVSLWAPTLIF